MVARAYIKWRHIILPCLVVIGVTGYAYAIDKVSQTIPDLTWPLVLNAVLPGGLIFAIGKRYLDKQDKTLSELINAKNDHAGRIDKIETVHHVRGCDQAMDFTGQEKRAHYRE